MVSATWRASVQQRHVAGVGQRGQPQVALPLLAGARAASLAPHAQVGLGQREAVGRAGHRGQPLVALLAAEQVAPAGRAAAADPAPQLVQLCDAEAVGALHDHDGGLGDVDADLDDRGGDQHIELAGAEAVHHLLADGGRHLAVHEPDAQPRQLAGRQPLELLAGRLGLDPQRVADQRADDEGPVPRGHLLRAPGPRRPARPPARRRRAATRS